MGQLKVIKDGVEYTVRMGEQRISVSDISNVYSWDKCLQASFLVDIAIPIEGNEQIFGWKHLPAVKEGVYEWDARLYDEGRVMYYGKLQIRVSALDSFRGSYNFDFIASNLNGLLDEKSVREVLTQTVHMGTTITDIKSYMTAAAASSYPTHPVTFFPIYAPNFYGEVSVSSFIGVANYWPQGGSSFALDEPLLTNNEPNNVWRYNCVPQVYMLAALVKCFETFGYTVSGDALQDAFMLSICVEGKKSMDDIGGKTAILKTTDEQTFTTQAAIDWGEITQNRIGAGVTTGTTAFTNPPSLVKWKLELDIADCSGDEVGVYLVLNGSSYFVKNILPEIGNRITIDAEGTEVAASFGFRLACAGSVTLGVGSSVILTDELGFANWVRGSFELGECLPDISAIEFLQGCKQFGLEYIVDDVAKKVEVRVIKNMLEENASATPAYLGDAKRISYSDRNTITMRYNQEDADTGGLPFIGNYLTKADLPADNATLFGTAVDKCYAYVVNENAYYKLSTASTVGSQPYVKELLGQRNINPKIGDGKTVNEYVHKGKLSLMTVTNDTPSSQYYLMPWILDEGYTNFPGPDYPQYELVQGGEWVLRFVQYYGMQSGSAGTYPLAGVSGITYDGTELDITHLSIDETAKGCWRRYLKPWLTQHLNRDEYERKMLPMAGESMRSLRGKRLYFEGQYWYAKEIKRGSGSETPWTLVLVRRVVKT